MYLVELRGKYGDVYPYNQASLIAHTDSIRIFSRLLTLPWVIVHSSCEPVEGEVRFPWEQVFLNEVGRTLKLRRLSGPRRLSNEHRNKLREASKQSRFTVDQGTS